MSIVTNTYTGYTAKGIRENLTDTIYNIEPEETPFMSSVGRGSTKTTFKEWQQDTLDARSSTNQQLEGDDIASFPAITPTVRVGTYAEIARKLIILADTLEVVDKAGRKSELAYQTSLKAAALKRDMEVSMLENKGANAGNTTTARVTAGMGAWVKSNDVFGTGGASPVYTTLPSAARTDGTQAAFTETMLRNAVKLAYDAGGRPTVLSVGSFNKALISTTFDGIAQVHVNTKESAVAVIGAVDVYVSDFGKLAIHTNLNQRARDAWLLTPSGISVDYLRPYAVVKLAKTGDAEKRMLIVEYLLKVNHEAQHALVADLTTA